MYWLYNHDWVRLALVIARIRQLFFPSRNVGHLIISCENRLWEKENKLF